MWCLLVIVTIFVVFYKIENLSARSQVIWILCWRKKYNMGDCVKYGCIKYVAQNFVSLQEKLYNTYKGIGVESYTAQ